MQASYHVCAFTEFTAETGEADVWQKLLGLPPAPQLPTRLPIPTPTERELSPKGVFSPLDSHGISLEQNLPLCEISPKNTQHQT